MLFTTGKTHVPEEHPTAEPLCQLSYVEGFRVLRQDSNLQSFAEVPAIFTIGRTSKPQLFSAREQSGGGAVYLKEVNAAVHHWPNQQRTTDN